MARGLLLAWVLISSLSHEHALSSPPPTAATSLVTYLDGLDALIQGQAADAVTAFSQTLEMAGDDPNFVLARGVAETLAEQFPQAIKDFQRAQRLGLKGREAELWTYVAEQMGGLVTPAHAHPTPRGSQRQSDDGGLQREPAYQDRSCEFTSVGIPGHVIQGRDDYPTAYASYLFYEMANTYGKARRCGKNVQAKPVREAMLKSGRWFASRFMKRADLAPAHLARAKQQYAARQYEATLREIEFARAAYPGDPDLVYFAADSWLALGRPATARREFTIALTGRTNFAPAYLGRAMAAARLGDARRARMDLEAAARLDADATGKARPLVEAELARQKVEGSPDKLLTDLEQAARTGTPIEDRAGLAAKVLKAHGNERLRYDEIYQDRLRILEDAVRSAPKNPDKLVQLAEYMLDESDNRGEKVEPRREVILYRWQESKEAELRRAIGILDRALALNPKHVGALIQKALGLTALKQYASAEKLADQALALSSNNADALRLYARFRAMRANQLSAEAAGLRQERCTSSTRTENRSDGVYEVRTTTCYPPSQRDLQLAAQLEAEAANLRRKARAAMENAVRVSTGVQKLLIQADVHQWDGQLNGAQAYLEQAVQLDPRSLEAQDALADFYAKTGQLDKAEEQQAIARRLIHWTAAPMLRLAWRRIDKTAWEGARTALLKGRGLDEEDARVPAYLGVVFEGQNKPDEAVAAYRTAAALEAARLELDESESRAGHLLRRDPLDFGLAVQIRLHLAALMERAGKKVEAVDHYQAAVAFEPRMEAGGESRQMFTAMLPDQSPERGAVVPAPVNAATLFADAHLRAGKLLRDMGKTDQAMQHFAAAVKYGPQRMAGIPMVGNAQGDTNYAWLAKGPAAEASLYLAQALVAKGDIEAARRMLYEVGRDLPESLRDDLNQLNMAMGKMRNQQPRETDSRVSAEQPQYEGLQRRRNLNRNRRASRHMAPKAKVVPELVGIWELSPDNKFLPWKKTLTIENNASYTLVLQNDGSTTRGKMDVRANRNYARDESQPASGQMMLFDESGEVSTMWYEFGGNDMITITDLDGTKYEARRR